MIVEVDLSPPHDVYDTSRHLVNIEQPLGGFDVKRQVAGQVHAVDSIMPSMT
jgi:hypothetical protein